MAQSHLHRSLHKFIFRVLLCTLGSVASLSLQTSNAQALPARWASENATQIKNESLELVGFLPLEASRVAVEGNYAYVAGKHELSVVDISEPSDPVKVGALSLPGHPSSVSASGHRVYVGLGYLGVKIINVSTPTKPEEAGQFTVPGAPLDDAYVFDVAVNGNIIYVAADDGAGLRILNVSDPNSPRELGVYSVYSVWDVVLRNNLAYLAAYEEGLLILNVGTSSSPQKVDSLNIPGFLAYDVAVSDGKAFITYGSAQVDGDRGLWVVDITDAPTEVAFFPQSSWFGPLAAANQFVYVAGESGLRIIDVSDPRAPNEIASDSELGGDVVAADNYIYVADSSGLSILRLFTPPATITGQVVNQLGHAVPGVTLSDGAGHTATTNSGGNFTLTDLPVGTYTLTPQKDGYSFSPASRTVAVPPDATHQDFTAMVATCPAGQWRVDYFGNRDLQGNPAYTDCVGDIDFFWGQGAAYDSGPTNNWSARWSRTVQIPTTGWYHFRAFTDDGLRLYVDGKRVIDDWTARDFAEQSTIQKLTQGPHQITLEYVEWADDAMAHLTWYRTTACPDNATSCTSRITPLYQTQHHGPMPAACETAPFNTTTDDPNDRWVQTFAGQGCKVASLTMALQRYGVSASLATVNAWLTDNDGYTGSCTGGLTSNDMFTKFAGSRGVSLSWNEATNLADAQRAVQSGNPVLLQVRGAKTSSHFVLAAEVIQARHPATGQLQETLGINDPHHSWKSWASLEQFAPPGSTLRYSTPPTVLEHATTLLEELDYIDGTTVIPIGYLTKTVGARTASLQINAKNTEILLKFDDGRRLGYDPAVGMVVDEVNNAVYYDGEVVPPGGQPSGLIQRTLFLMEDAARSFVLWIFGPSSDEASAAVVTPFEVTLVGLDADYNVIEQTITGNVLAGQKLEYALDYGEDGTLEVTPLGEERGSEIYLPTIVRP